MNFSVLSFVIFILLSTPLFSQSKIEKMNWGDLEVVWIKDESLPLYTASLYFADGAKSDGRKTGITQMSLDLLVSGTRRFNQEQILDTLDFYGVSVNSYVTHEYSTFSFSGLVKDLVPTAKKICHLFDDAIYPIKRIKQRKKQLIASLDSLNSSPDSLASRGFRYVSMKGTPFNIPPSGNKSTIKKIWRSELKSKLTYLKSKVYKKLYISGPSSLKKLKPIILEECGFNFSKDLFKRKIDYTPKKISKKPSLYFMPLSKKSNQAQIYMGRFMNKDEVTNHELLSVLSSLTGGGGNSLLVQELRKKRGLVYSAWAVASPQRDYGRVVIGAATKNASAVELVTVVKNVFDEVSLNGPTNDLINWTKGSLAGSTPFTFENMGTYLSELIIRDHVGKDLSSIYNFSDIVRSIRPDQIHEAFKKVFNFDSFDILVVGNPALKKEFAKKFKIKTIKPSQVL